MAVSISKFPQCLKIPTITNNKKYLTWFFPFLTETSTSLKKGSSHTKLLSVLSYSTCLSLRFGSEERRCMMLHSPFLAVAGGGKGRVCITQSHHTPWENTSGPYFLLARRCLEQTQRPLLNAAFHWSPRVSPVCCCAVEGAGPIPCVCGVTEQCWARTPKV